MLPCTRSYFLSSFYLLTSMDARERYVFYNPLPECWADGHLPERCCPDSDGRNGNVLCFDTEHSWHQCCGSQARFWQRENITSVHKNFTWAPNDNINLIPIPHSDNLFQSAALFAPMYASMLNRRFDSSLSRASLREASPRPIPGQKKRVIAEIGVLRGEFSAMLLRYLKFPLEYYSIDPWTSMMNLQQLPYSDASLMRENLIKTIGNVAPYWDRIHIVQMPSMKALRLFEDETISFLFIDGDHSAEAVEEEIAHYWPKIAPGGIMGGHDYATTGLGGVKPAVDAFGKRINQRPRLLSFIWFGHCWYFTKPQ